ncbi:hypothetical protein HDV05_005160 [Chytridiales sp. JEL 0842]|nr:hypothetical protein HDV05_005160 [Chytridiales sp. JEL 0842]
MNFDNNATLQRVPSHRRSTASSAPPPMEEKGFFQKLLPKNPYARYALLFALIQFLVLIIIQSVVIVRHISEFNDLAFIRNEITKNNPAFLDSMTVRNLNATINQARAITVYKGLFMVGHAFLLYLGFDAILTSSKIQLFSATTFNFSCLAYSILQYIQAGNLSRNVSQDVSTLFVQFSFQVHRTGIFEIIVIVFSFLFFCGWLFFSQRLYSVFGWSIFKELGADVSVAQRLKYYHIFMMLLKLDVFFFLGFAVQYVILVLNSARSVTTTVILVNVLTLPPAALILLFLAYFAITRESNFLTVCLLLGLSGGVGYLIDRLVDIYTTTDPEKYASSRISLTVFIVLTMLMSLATFVSAILNFREFGKGLMQSLSEARANSKNKHRKSEVGDGMEMQNY